MKKSRLVLLAVAFTILFTQSAWAQKEKYQSIFIYNFGKYVKWPDSKMSGEFVIGVLGKSPLTQSLTSMATGNRQAQGLKISVKEFSSLDDIEQCHILFVADQYHNQIQSVASKTSNHATLLVTDGAGMAKKGSVINFVEQEGKIKFELNQANAESRGLKVSSSLVNLAIVV